MYEKGDLHINKDFTDFFKAVRVSSHDNNVMRHVVIIFGIYSHKKLSKIERENIIYQKVCKEYKAYMYLHKCTV